MRADLDVTVDLARALLAEQHPDLADRPLELVANGWDNVMLRLGPGADGARLALRLPRREVAAPLVRHEIEWLPVLAPRLPAVVPEPVLVGRPSAALGYPWWWAVVSWVDGRRAADVPVAERGVLAEPLAAFFLALHAPAPSAAPHNPVRGVPLRTRDAPLRGRVERGVVPDDERVLALWEDLVRAPAWDRTAVWLHGDPHPGNLVVADDGTLAAVVDFGDMTAGDPATDLAAAWLVLDADGRGRFRDALAGRYPADDPVWLRARGWALTMATGMLESGPEHAWVHAMGVEALARVLDET
ncbi:aminoglycoside phosphotransferase family protein [Isoptericola variabilis]|uniref:Aminoglycoside phosphotransferase n=1 Tax=Isoptericola variabilis (strain 225) TaxID=743718 RepID=F6FWE0_ISOV2|nr:aminoglycoside phosphotransferase family protein [Isoptericola variabilis]AEG44514.1 aminoglycoside phosphotransferase [Isoptericola variabilis 225]TWH26570.1 aminoglycoside phosphotransferase (APT) family kinase protein [Isoptericola variabilis J7]